MFHSSSTWRPIKLQVSSRSKNFFRFPVKQTTRQRWLPSLIVALRVKARHTSFLMHLLLSKCEAKEEKRWLRGRKGKRKNGGTCPRSHEVPPLENVFKCTRGGVSSFHDSLSRLATGTRTARKTNIRRVPTRWTWSNSGVSVKIRSDGCTLLNATLFPRLYSETTAETWKPAGLCVSFVMKACFVSCFFHQPRIFTIRLYISFLYYIYIYFGYFIHLYIFRYTCSISQSVVFLMIFRS